MTDGWEVYLGLLVPMVSGRGGRMLEDQLLVKQYWMIRVHYREVDHLMAALGLRWALGLPLSQSIYTT